MIPQATGSQLNSKLLEELNNIPARFGFDPALTRIAELGRELMNSVVCSITVLDLDQQHFVPVASAGIPKDSERRLRERQYSMERDGKGTFDFPLISSGNVITKYGLDRDGQGVAKAEACKRHRIHSLLAVPLRSGTRLLGYMNHFSAQTGEFTESQTQTLQAFSNLAVTAIETMEQNVIFTHLQGFALERVVAIGLESESLESFIEELGEIARIVTNTKLCIVWLLDKAQNGFVARVVSRAADKGAEEDTLDRVFMQGADLKTFLKETHWVDAPFSHNLGRYEKHWAVPLRVYDQPVAILEVAGAASAFTSRQRSMLGQLGVYTAVAIKNLGQKKALEHVNRTLSEITKAEKKEEVMVKLLEGSLTLLGSQNGCTQLLDDRSEEPSLALSPGSPGNTTQVKLEKGISGLALKQLQPIRLDDVSNHMLFYHYWPDTVSAMAVPIYTKAAKVRYEATLGTRMRPLGVLNVESPTPGAYSEFDEQCLVTMADYAAVVLDQLEFDAKLTALNRAETELASVVSGPVVRQEEWEQLVDKVLREITAVLGYSHVNLSMVSTDGTRILTEHVGGTWLSEEEAQEFTKLADHELNGTDIQACVVKDRQIVVPARNDPRNDTRFDPKIHWKFRMDRLVLVYVPMILGGVVVGTIEAGYERRFGVHIYERDIQILHTFVDYLTAAIGRRRRDLLEKLGHEFDTAIRGIESNADFLRRHRKRLHQDRIDRKLTDILADCGVLDSQARNLEFYLTGRAPKPRLEMTAIARDVILKTISQFEPEMLKQGWKRSAIEFDYIAHSDMRAYVDKAQACEVMTNLFVNAVKYRDPEDRFRMEIHVSDFGEFYLLQVQDWGIGVRQGLEEAIFEEGFRAPEAMEHVHGTGYGLAISRQIMRQMGGDIRLSHNSNPTEFEIRLPKRAKIQEGR